jgi:protease I
MARIAMPLAEGFEDSEFTVPYERLKAEGHEILVIGAAKGDRLQGKRGRAKVFTDAAASEVQADEFDALVIPGGYSPDHLRLDPDVVSLVRQFAASGRLIAAVCHGPQLLIEADAVRGRTLTSWPSIRKDLENAGAAWLDRALVEDGNLITSRKPEDLNVFTAAIARRISTKWAA